MTRILICLEDAERRERFARWLDRREWTVDMTTTEREMLERVLSHGYDAAVVAVDTLESVRALGLVQKIAPELPLIAVTRDDALAFEREVRKEKVFFYLVEPVEQKEFCAAVENAVSNSQSRMKSQRGRKP